MGKIHYVPTRRVWYQAPTSASRAIINEFIENVRLRHGDLDTDPYRLSDILIEAILRAFNDENSLGIRFDRPTSRPDSQLWATRIGRGMYLIDGYRERSCGYQGFVPYSYSPATSLIDRFIDNCLELADAHGPDMRRAIAVRAADIVNLYIRTCVNVVVSELSDVMANVNLGTITICLGNSANIFGEIRCAFSDGAVTSIVYAAVPDVQP